MKNQIRNRHIPDILDTIANISNDEVFTPPALVNQILDMLPQELFKSSKTTFLDPCCKTGIFLREIVKRLDEGLEEEIPNTEERIQHILAKQVYGISITHLCHLMTKRTVYCSKYANECFSLAEGLFNSEDGNIIFDESLDHDWDENGKCKICGMTKEILNEKETKEKYAYWFIHKSIDEINKRFNNMKFDVIIANPPYQLKDGGKGASAIPIYNKFVETALKLKPNYISMIIPSRWQVGGKGLNDFREMMLKDRHIIKMVDFVNSKDCFSGVDIKGGVCYFLRDSSKEEECEITTYYSGRTPLLSKRYLLDDEDNIFIRDYRLIPIKNKVNFENNSFSSIASVSRPYGLRTDAIENISKYCLPKMNDTKTENVQEIEILGLLKNKRVKKYVPLNYPFPKIGKLSQYKIFISKAYGCGAIGEEMATPILATPMQACTETFIEIGGFDNKNEAENCLKYIKTKFFRLLVGLKKITQDATAKVYKFVPLQNFTDKSDIDWSKSISDIDKQLYQKYNLTVDEINLIEELIKPME